MNPPQKLKISRIIPFGKLAKQKKIKQNQKNESTQSNAYLLEARKRLQSFKQPPTIPNDLPIESNDIIEVMLLNDDEDIEIISRIITNAELGVEDKVIEFEPRDESMTLSDLCTGFIEIISDDELTDNDDMQSYASYDEYDIDPSYCGKILSRKTSISSVEISYSDETFYELCDKYNIRTKYMDIFEHQLGITASCDVQHVIQHNKPGDLIKCVYNNKPNTRDLICMYKLISYCIDSAINNEYDGLIAQVWINSYNRVNIWYHISPEPPLSTPSHNKLKNKLKTMRQIILDNKSFHITKLINYTNANLSNPQNIIDVYVDELATDMCIMLCINSFNKCINVLCDSNGVVYKDNMYKDYLVRPFDNGSMLKINLAKNKILFQHKINNNIINKCDVNVLFYDENTSELSIQVIIGQREGTGKYFISSENN